MSESEKFKKAIPDIKLQLPKTEDSAINQCDKNEMMKDNTEDDNEVKSRKNNMFSNCRITMNENNFSSNSSPKDVQNENQLFVVDRRDSTVVDCMESTPLPSPNLSEKSKMNFNDLNIKNQSQSRQQSSTKLCASNRLGVKRYF